MALEPTRRHLNGLGEKWDNNIPTTKFLWTIDFQGRNGTKLSNGLATNVKQVLQDYEGTERWTFLDGLFDERSDAELGFLYAQSVALPQEQVVVGTVPVQRAGGIVAGYYGDRRADYGNENKLDIAFLEQNKDVIDLFIRPWLVAVSYHGLIEDETDLKCDIVVNLHGKNPDGRGFKDVPFGDMINKRKTYKFENCVPITVEADQISYDGETSQSDITRTCSFAFSKYTTFEIDTAAGGRTSRDAGGPVGDFNTDIFRPIA